MSKPILTLPCKYRLSDFEHRDGKHHCTACSHNLVDFRNATDEEISAALKAASGRTCGIFRPDQTQAGISFFQLGLQRRIGVSLLGILGFTSPVVLTSCDYTKDTVQQKDAFSKLRFPMQLKGTLTDKHSGKPIANAAISILQDGKVLLSGKTDGSGHFRIEVNEGDLSDSHFDLVLARLGYENDTVRAVDTWNTEKQRHMQLSLQATPVGKEICAPGKATVEAFVEPPLVGDVIEVIPSQTLQGEVRIPPQPEQ